jgi:hypothetical protein
MEETLGTVLEYNDTVLRALGLTGGATKGIFRSN